jgi:hypothetical protein
MLNFFPTWSVGTLGMRSPNREWSHRYEIHRLRHIVTLRQQRNGWILIDFTSDPIANVRRTKLVRSGSIGRARSRPPLPENLRRFPGWCRSPLMSSVNCLLRRPWYGVRLATRSRDPSRICAISTRLASSYFSHFGRVHLHQPSVIREKERQHQDLLDSRTTISLVWRMFSRRSTKAGR